MIPSELRLVSSLKANKPIKKSLSKCVSIDVLLSIAFNNYEQTEMSIVEKYGISLRHCCFIFHRRYIIHGNRQINKTMRMSPSVPP